MTDPVRARRARFQRAAQAAQRVGYALFGASALALVGGLAFGLSGAWAGASAVGLIAGTVVLAPAIVLAYMVKAAEREDRERGL